MKGDNVTFTAVNRSPEISQADSVVLRLAWEVEPHNFTVPIDDRQWGQSMGSGSAGINRHEVMDERARH